MDVQRPNPDGFGLFFFSLMPRRRWSALVVSVFALRPCLSHVFDVFNYCFLFGDLILVGMLLWLFKNLKIYSGVAQLAVRLTVNQEGVGSRPTSGVWPHLPGGDTGCNPVRQGSTPCVALMWGEGSSLSCAVEVLLVARGPSKPQGSVRFRSTAFLVFCGCATGAFAARRPGEIGDHGRLKPGRSPFDAGGRHS